MTLDLTRLAVEARLSPQVYILCQELPDKTAGNQSLRSTFTRMSNLVEVVKHCSSGARGQWTSVETSQSNPGKLETEPETIHFRVQDWQRSWTLGQDF